jgi:hypothetical protein
MNLVQTSAFVRKFINILLAFFALYVVYLIVTPILLSAIYFVFPPKDLPNPIFGKLPPLQFIEKQLANERPGYSLNTTDGKLPRNLPTKMTVYEVKPPQFSYEAGKTSQQHAEDLGFTDDDLITDLKGSIYRWRTLSTGGTLEIDTISRQLTLTTPLAGKASLFVRGNLNQTYAKTQAIGLLTRLDRYNDPLYSQGEQKFTFGRIENNQIKEAGSEFDAHVVRVDFFRNVDETPILGPDATKGMISVTLKVQDNQNKALNYPFIEYIESELVPTTSERRAIYPLITVADAWKAVSVDRKGVIASVQPVGNSVFDFYAPQKADQILINNIYLAYYDAPASQKYLQPIYVFEGKYNVANRPGGDIVIYFPALDGNYVQELDTSTQ